MDRVKFELQVLPAIEMYGGDTTPWEITLVRKDGSKVAYDGTGEDCAVTIQFAPLNTAGKFGHAPTITPVLSKAATLSRIEANGGTLATFTFTRDDTINLWGKFIYQIDVNWPDPNTQGLRVLQGTVTIMQNVNRTSNGG